MLNAAMIVKNFNSIATTPERKIILYLAEHGIKSVLPRHALGRILKWEDGVLYTPGKKFALKNKRVFVVGAGKASAAMAESLEAFLGGDQITAGAVLSNDTGFFAEKIEILPADHPIPTERNTVATERVLGLKERFNIGSGDLVIGLVSGGGSAMLVSPAEGISLADKQKVTELLISGGAGGYENTVVKTKLSKVKGGRLAEYFAPAHVLSLILSDDNGEATHEMTASGPFSPDLTTYSDAWEAFERLKIIGKTPPSIRSFFRERMKNPVNMPDLSRVHQIVIAHNETALEAIATAARDRGIEVVMKKYIKGEAAETALEICAEIRQTPVDAPTLFLYGGETRVTLSGSPGVGSFQQGKGGRNQELVLSCLAELKEQPLRNRWCIAAIATDGVDFIQEAAGAVIDNNSLKEAQREGFVPRSFLATHDSFTMLSRINSVISTGGSTGTNVGDIILFYVSPW